MPDVAFDADRLEILGQVFDQACGPLQIDKKNKIARTALARIIFALAVKGEGDDLLDGVLRQYRRMYRREDERRVRIEMALDEALRQTFPASDAVALVQPVASRPR